ncbi:unnamed protein product, partial [Coregonus sp. 'balchen']
MLVVPEQEYPMVCVAISQATEPGQVVRFETINLNSCSSWFTEMGSSKEQTHTHRDRDRDRDRERERGRETERGRERERERERERDSYLFTEMGSIGTKRKRTETWKDYLDYLKCSFSVAKHVVLKRVLSPAHYSKALLLFFLVENLKIVNLQGRLKSNKKLASELSFDFAVGSVVCLQDSVLAFWRHGMQGKSFKSNEVGVT